MSNFKFASLLWLVFMTVALPASAKSVNLFPADAQAQWKRIAIPPTNPVSAIAQWHIDAAKRTIVCDGNGGHDWLKFNKELHNFSFHVKWRVEPGAGKYNSGVFFRNNEDGSIWHQAQTTPDGGYLFGLTPVDGKPTPFNARKSMSENRVKPAGEWNDYDLRCVGGTCSLAVNGATVNTIHVGLEKGYIGLESEGFKIEFKEFKVTELP